jgi:hypothetical protein
MESWNYIVECYPQAKEYMTPWIGDRGIIFTNSDMEMILKSFDGVNGIYYCVEIHDDTKRYGFGGNLSDWMWDSIREILDKHFRKPIMIL